MIVVESAAELDSQIIWEWRNDKLTRSVSRNTDFISWNTHDAWFRQSLENPERFLYVGIHLEADSQTPIGVVRFDMVDSVNHYYEVSINIAPLARGKGFGSLLLAFGTKALLRDVAICRRIYAEVKTENISSNSFFLSAGYSSCENICDGFNSYYIDLP